MANENWEEISEWDIEEDVDLAQRITVHSVHSIDDDEEYQLIQAHKHPTYAAAAKWGGRKSSSSNSVASKPNKTSLEKKKSSSTSPKNDDKNNKSADTILKGDHNVDYDTLDSTSDPSESKNWKETRRNNTKLHKTHSQKLMSTLISNAELESNQDLVKGDTNRDPEFKKYKLLKKTMALNKKLTEKSKNDRKNLRVEVW